MPGSILIVVSDLHLGAGYYVGANKLEDFTSDSAFADLLQTIAQESERAGRPVELIINGDFGEFLQSPNTPAFEANQIYGVEAYRPMNEAASITKLRHIMAGHTLLFDALRAWLRLEAPQRRLIITKGNHDPQWHWSSVQAFLRQAIGATGAYDPLLEFPLVGYAAPGVYIEHGNQYAEAANRFTDFAQPFDPNDRAQLETPWGSKFVIEFFNSVERDKYWVDGVTPYGSLVWFGLKYDPAFAFRALSALLRAAPRLIGVRDNVMDSWLTNIQTHSEQAAERYRTEEQYRKDVVAFTAHALSSIEPGVRAMDAVVGDEDPRQLAADLISERQRELSQAAARLAEEHRASVVLFGHTHVSVNELLVNGARYINTGTWTWLMDFANASDDEWRDLFANPNKYAARRRLNYARIDYDEAGNPTAQLLEWQPTMAPPTLTPGQPSWFERLIAFIKKLLGIR